MAIADAMRRVARVSKGPELAELDAFLRQYGAVNPPHPRFEYDLLDLQEDFGVDLSWWPAGVSLIRPRTGGEDEEDDADEEEDTGVEEEPAN
ncbi:hypothetical protein ACS0TY_033094 [Phlomoides rotata]